MLACFKTPIAGLVLCLAAVTLFIAASTANAGCGPTGGLSPSEAACAPPAGSKAKLVNGTAIAPKNAPPGVMKVIAAANRIRTKPYVWGGGHGRWWDKGYDCSGAVSYALRGAKLLPSPLDSSSLASWGTAGEGQWITVYANAGHTYAVIAGLRWDTAGSAKGTGPRWYGDSGSAVSGAFTIRHPTGY